MRKPLLPIAAAFITGILLGEWMRLTATALLPAIAGAAAISILSLLAPDVGRAPVRDLVRAGSVLMLVALVAALYSRHHNDSFPHNHLRHLVGPERTIAKVHCRVVDHPVLRRDEPLVNWTPRQESTPLVRTSCTVEVTKLWADAGPIPCTGHARLTVYEAVRDLAYGDELHVTGFISTPAAPRNPAQFDYRRYLARQGIHVALTAPFRGNVTIVQSGGGSTFWRLVYGFKQRLERFIYGHVPDPQASVLSCILLGNRAAVPETVENDFRRTGTVHVLSVSGLHMALLASTLWMALRVFRLRQATAAFVVLAFVCLYTAMTGAASPPLRAGIMAAAFCLGVIIHRQPQLINSLALAALAILVIDPNEVFNVGFILSFLCVLGIGLYYTPILALISPTASPLDALDHSRKAAAWRWLKHRTLQCIAVSAAAQLVTAPIVASQFNLINWLGLLSNIFIVILAWLALVGGMTLVVAGTFLPIGYSICAVAADAITRLFLGGVRLMSSAPLCASYVAGPSYLWVLGYFALLALLLLRHRLALRPAIHIILGLALFAGPVCFWVLAPHSGKFSLTCYDVGHGNAILVRLPANRVLLYDCGTLGKYDVGKNVLAPHLWSQGITHLDAIILSHPHADHVNGVPSLLERFRVGRLVVAPGFGQSPTGQAILTAAMKSRVPVVQVSAGDRLVLHREATLHVLHPPPNHETFSLLQTNDRSLVLHMQAQGAHFLLTGDAGAAALRMGYRRQQPQNFRAVQVSHHGAQAEVAALLARQTRPQIALISAGDTDRFGLSARKLLHDGVLPLSTPQCGAITLVMKGPRTSVHAFLDMPPPVYR